MSHAHTASSFWRPITFLSGFFELFCRIFGHQETVIVSDCCQGLIVIYRSNPVQKIAKSRFFTVCTLLFSVLRESLGRKYFKLDQIHCLEKITFVRTFFTKTRNSRTKNFWSHFGNFCQIGSHTANKISRIQDIFYGPFRVTLQNFRPPGNSGVCRIRVIVYIPPPPSPPLPSPPPKPGSAAR